MALSLKYLSPDERDEWRRMLDAALNGTRQADNAAVDRAMAMLDQADRSGSPWPDLIREQAVRAMLRSELKAYAKAEAATVVTVNGRALVKSQRRGVRVASADGSLVHQQKLFMDMSWDELGTWIATTESQVRGLLDNREMARKLLDLQRMVPRSTGPADAAGQLGTTVEAVLAA